MTPNETQRLNASIELIMNAIRKANQDKASLLKQLKRANSALNNELNNRKRAA